MMGTQKRKEKLDRNTWTYYGGVVSDLNEWVLCCIYISISYLVLI